jgi:ABC-type antimicrobial peptide transport system permease subunit
MTLLSSFAALALILTAIGLYGTVAYSVAQRTREFGIRLALGARAGDVLRAVLPRALAMTATGVVVGLAGATVLTRMLGSLLFEVSPTDSSVFVVIVGLLLLVGVAASFPPALRATRVDPVVVLRYE